MSENSFFERDPLAEPNRAGRWAWVVRGGAVIVALAAIYGVTRIVSSEPAWHRAGLASDPGAYVKSHPIDYEVCTAWSGWTAAAKPPAGYRVSSILATPLPALETTTHYSLLLPNNSKIAAIYCGSSDGGAVSECSPDGCDAPVIVQLDDDIHANQRVLTLSLEGKEPKPRAERALRVWVVWRP